MKPDRAWRQALDGETFSTQQRFRIPRAGTLPLRIDVVRSLTEGQRVLHVGCVDHVEVLDEKIAKGTWLHAQVAEVAETCVGVDVSGPGIDALRERGWNDVFVGSVAEPSSFLDPAVSFDLMLLGEVVEHVDDPVAFLADISSAWRGRCERLVLTLPNAFGWSTLRSAFRSTEVVNTDHRFWFTPFTAAKVATRAGFDVDQIVMCAGFAPPRGRRPDRVLKRALVDVIGRASPILGSTVLLELSWPQR